MKDLLTRNGVEPIEALGKPFDPNLHEAMMQVPSEEYDEGTVAMEISKGYKQGDRVLRHSKVGVSAPPKHDVEKTEGKDEAESGGEAEADEK
jgi:molecular chaperone GrpE (heat shock protein)